MAGLRLALPIFMITTYRDAEMTRKMLESGAKALSCYCALVALLALAADPAFAAGEVSNGPSELLFVAQIVLLMLIGRLLGEVMLRFKQPAVMGQLIAGLVLGPSV